MPINFFYPGIINQMAFSRCSAAGFNAPLTGIKSIRKKIACRFFPGLVEMNIPNMIAAHLQTPSSEYAPGSAPEVVEQVDPPVRGRLRQ